MPLFRIFAVFILVSCVCPPPAAAQEETESEGDARAKLASMVRINRFRAEAAAPEIRLSGLTDYKKHVNVKARMTREVEELITREGAYIGKGEPLLKLKSENIHADLAEAEALLKQRREDYNSFSKLRRTRDIASSTVSQSFAALKQAEATVSHLKRDIKDLTAFAPFNAYVNRIPVREGDVTIANQTVLAEVFDPSSLIVRADLAERLLSRVEQGVKAYATGPDGERYDIEVSYISAVADEATRTFSLEARVLTPQPEQGAPMPDGMTMTLHIPAATKTAHKIPMSALSLSDSGDVGVKIKENDKAAFYNVDFVNSGDSLGYIFVEGLPETADIVVTGHAYIAEGTDLSGIAVSPRKDIAGESGA